MANNPEFQPGERIFILIMENFGRTERELLDFGNINPLGMLHGRVVHASQHMPNFALNSTPVQNLSNTMLGKTSLSSNVLIKKGIFVFRQ